ncbi:hypothetical protein, partial [Pseudomonas aeruginosa]|uniref:hypothetical protein n=1 Tax=Pseudomonas aeruginosa TaxID=287 RepID=UPI00195589F5
PAHAITPGNSAAVPIPPAAPQVLSESFRCLSPGATAVQRSEHLSDQPVRRLDRNAWRFRQAGRIRRRRNFLW